jgi:hypothetical protein
VSLPVCIEGDSRQCMSRPNGGGLAGTSLPMPLTKPDNHQKLCKKENGKNNMKRREFLTNSAILGTLAAFSFSAPDKVLAGSTRTASNAAGASESAVIANPLKPPVHGSIPVAFVISKNTVLIDFAGPWEVFEVASYAVSVVNGVKDEAFQLYTVAEITKPIHASGVKITPDYTFNSAPPPKIIVIPQQEGATENMLDWIRKSTKNTDVTMSICTGAYTLAKTGLLSGKSATTRCHGTPFATHCLRS